MSQASSLRKTSPSFSKIWYLFLFHNHLYCEQKLATNLLHKRKLIIWCLNSHLYWLRCWTWEKQSLIFSCSCSSGFLMALDVLESSAALWSTSSITAVGIFSWTPVLQNHSTATALGCILSPAHLVQSHSLIDSNSYIEVHISITGVTSHNKCVDLFPVIKHSILHGICACSLLCTELQKDKIWTKILLPL